MSDDDHRPEGGPEEGPDRPPGGRRETRASRRSHAPGRDPRDIVTEYAFQVDPDLLGVPLAGAFRRLAGMLVDLFVLALLFPIRAALGSFAGGLVDLVVALAVASMLVRLASPRSGGRTPSTWVRILLRGIAVVVALVGIGGAFGGGDGGDADEAAERARREAAPEVRRAEAIDALASGEDGPARLGGRDVSLLSLLRGAGDWVDLVRADSAAEARPAAERVARQLEDAGATPAEVRDAIRDLLAADRPGEPWMEEVAAAAAGVADSAARRERLAADSAATGYARALAAGDSAAADSLRPALRDALAGDRIEALERRNRQLRDELEGTEDELERTEDELDAATDTRGLVARSMDVITEDLGIGLGWLGLYFTAFLALWGGRTPGKRLLGMRVVQLDGRPLGWWDAFGRFGGYAAGIVTGMLGYLQIFWDPNRQALHDKVAGTVVIRTRGPGKPYEPRKS